VYCYCYWSVRTFTIDSYSLFSICLCFIGTAYFWVVEHLLGGVKLFVGSMFCCVFLVWCLFLFIFRCCCELSVVRCIPVLGCGNFLLYSVSSFLFLCVLFYLRSVFFCMLFRAMCSLPLFYVTWVPWKFNLFTVITFLIGVYCCGYWSIRTFTIYSMYVCTLFLWFWLQYWYANSSFQAKSRLLKC
jgi:hypothetical protein